MQLNNQMKTIKPLLIGLILLLTSFVLIISHTTHVAHAKAGQNESTEKTSASQVIVTAMALNVREAGDLSSPIMTVIHKGDRLTVIQTKNNWDEIKLSNNQTGWVSTTYITKAAPTESIGATVKAPVLNVRETPGLTSQVVDQLNNETKVTIHDELDGWAKIVSASGTQGWVDEMYLTKDDKIASNKAEQSKVSTHTISKISTSQASENTTITAKGQAAAKTIKQEPTQSQKSPLYGKTIVLDPGHGGKDDGTTSPISGTHEKTLTLATALDVAQKLKSAGAHVMMTRTTDTFIPLEQRAALSNQNHADAFISFHYNEASNRSANGILDFYYQKARDNQLASDLLKEVTKSTGLQNDGTRFDNLDVLRNNTQPCTLIELGFLSNQHDDSVVENATYRDQVAKGVYQGLLDYFSVE
ncbi:N-acetylmuramoyl-L-alanine amidase [Pullulanibacillus sp. KACC 23026]|uniref:N-acetylmuramoyl-L-alanine amidase n=1 Tax=Pullulanibacillus sp. KACC 23026 TaxID=3028315 RepID=UPI0023B074A2|nr:N-acetylmuramoyl-L-alanine amidase [Pullulanibacillus sp. KACC 23026]WEG13673.1 N-acetylmuramoyl-L-alanine amidase [Pullulanibacillus sp. KACC 23026]